MCEVGSEVGSYEVIPCFGRFVLAYHSIKQRVYYYIIFLKARIQIRDERKYEVYDEVKRFYFI